MSKLPKETSGDVREALFELQVDAFLDGIAVGEPNGEDYGLSHARSQELFDQASRKVA